MRLLGLDVGRRTIGLAVSDEGGVVSMPLRTLRRHGGARDLAAVAAVAAEQGAGALVLGLPLDLEGREGPAARRVRDLGAALAAHTGLAVHYVDERFTTVQADAALREAGLGGRRRRAVVDHVAAALILQGFLDRRRG